MRESEIFATTFKFIRVLFVPSTLMQKIVHEGKPNWRSRDNS